ncbi:hypothetical protein WJX84_004483 [Apatococcus fuscideae]|uniref:Cyclin N-terminal domain-containing protein n=1 Tax=Apatococcus fuscideae TaxID=2026836 RepID=A0AAW1SR04_9CHLO
MPVVPYVSTCRALKASADFLRLPWSTVATALVFLHRFKVQEHASSLQPNELVCVCLFLAAKVEEAGVSRQQLINVVACLTSTSHVSENAGTSIHLSRPPVVGKEYDAAKKQLPAAVAAGALWLAVKAGGMQSSPSQWPANWTEVIGIPDASLQDVLAELRHCII